MSEDAATTVPGITGALIAPVLARYRDLTPPGDTGGSFPRFEPLS